MTPEMRPVPVDAPIPSCVECGKQVPLDSDGRIHLDDCVGWGWKQKKNNDTIVSEQWKCPEHNRMTQPRFADMSSAQRSASMDNIVRQVEELTTEVNRLAAVKIHLDGHIAWHEKTSHTFWQRFRWLVTGR